MADQITLRGEGGSDHVFDLPLPPVFASQLRRGALLPVDAAGARLRAELRGDEVATIETPVDDGFDVAGSTVDEVLDWVGGDRDRALEALAVESGRDRPRSTLVEVLEGLTADPAPEEDPDGTN